VEVSEEGCVGLIGSFANVAAAEVRDEVRSDGDAYEESGDGGERRAKGKIPEYIERVEVRLQRVEQFVKHRRGLLT
jgi:hypothetical protein